MNDIKDLKNGIRIEDVISEYVDLEPMGSYLLRGLCPFHSEAKPSFTVYIKTQSFFCYGCGIGGDVITFLIKIEKISFKKAIDSLKNRVL